MTTASGNEDGKIRFSIAQEKLEIRCARPQPEEMRTLFVALATGHEAGSAVVPFGERSEGSTVFLPFQADRVYGLTSADDEAGRWKRVWENWRWSDRRAAGEEAAVEAENVVIRLPLADLTGPLKIAVYAKDFSQNTGWGSLVGLSDPTAGGEGDQVIAHYLEVTLTGKGAPRTTVRGRLGSERGRLRIYQLFVRLFGNVNETRQPNGALAQNGVGKFNDINDAALKSLAQMGFSHIWLTGVLEQASGTAHPTIEQPAADPDLLKGLAGSPYAIEDYFDVCADYAVEPKHRLAEFKALLGRIHAHKMKALIDFVPNHVARCYHSDIHPEVDFGREDDVAHFFNPANNFFHLQPNEQGPPLKLPTWRDGVALSPTCQVAGMGCDGLFPAEKEHGRVTGNNVVSWQPSLNDWYETVKLNYGYDFTDPAKNRREYPNARTPDKPVPNTWEKMDRVIAYWQSLGVDGFRCDMAHMEPPEFWKWLIAKARARAGRHPERSGAERNAAEGSRGAAGKPAHENFTETPRDPSTLPAAAGSAQDDNSGVVFIGEAYDNDPAKVPGSDPIIARLAQERGNVMFDLLDAGFNGVYDDPTYKMIKGIYEGGKWANDLDTVGRERFIFENSLRYAENHDEVRLASPSQWGGLGMKVGRPVSAILFGLSRGPVMVYNGQEVGEPATGAEGFGGDDSRTSIFDYWSMPEMVRWVDGHKFGGAKLSAEQKDLRAFYGRLVRLNGEPAFREGELFPLNPANHDNAEFGRVGDESASGHWCYAFLRHDPKSQQSFLVIANLHPQVTLRNVRVRFSPEALKFLQLSESDAKREWTDRLAAEPASFAATTAELSSTGLEIPELAPLSARYLEIAPNESK
ncbi:MAG: hypothetical protein ACR2MW_03580 [Chthoniobacterales bacterium]